MKDRKVKSTRQKLTKKQIQEDVFRALHDSSYNMSATMDELRFTMNKCSPVEFIVILQINEKMTQARDKLNELLTAMECNCQ